MSLLIVVVSYRNSTSNHNSGGSPIAPGGLYLIEILHQTTTLRPNYTLGYCCILSKFYIKPQQEVMRWLTPKRCILSKFYIKPQPWPINLRASTSCILSKFYIKPQLSLLIPFYIAVVSYRNSTSNHNIHPGG